MQHFEDHVGGWDVDDGGGDDLVHGLVVLRPRRVMDQTCTATMDIYEPGSLVLCAACQTKGRVTNLHLGMSPAYSFDARYLVAYESSRFFQGPIFSELV